MAMLQKTAHVGATNRYTQLLVWLALSVMGKKTDSKTAPKQVKTHLTFTLCPFSLS